MLAASLDGAPAGTAELAALATAVAVAVAWAYASWASRRWAAVVGVVLVAVAAVLLAVTPAGLSTVVIGLLAGAGTGLACGRPAPPRRWWWGGAAAGAVTVVAARLVGGVGWAMAAGVLVAGVGATARVLTTTSAAAPSRRRAVALVAGAAVLAVLLLAWTGANDPQLSWFGRVTSHGPSTGGRVAITFDDGPNATATLAVRDVLDRFGAKGTFFLVGRALDERPDLARALVDDGQLVGNHSYHHDQWRWLDPRYPELARTQAAFARQLGVCPRFFRPPHGERTPFVSAVVASKGMRTVTWDVSAGDWATTDPGLVARRVLAGVKPGSIVLLHDGLDGRVGVDRSVVVQALPIILEGLRARGLTPVRLDELLGVSGYLSSC